MSATILASQIVRDWDSLAADSPVNRETYLRNLLVDFQREIFDEISKPDCDCEFLQVWKEFYPIIKTLGSGWSLVAHQNGPAIARSENWQYLGHLSKHWTDRQDDVPTAIRYAAVESLMEWSSKQPTYPRMKP